MKKVWAAGLLSLCVACQVEGAAPAHVILDLTEWQAQSALTQVGNITLRVSAPDMRALTFVVPLSSDPTAAQLNADIPSGPARVFEITATGTDGQVMYWGRQAVDLPSAANVSVTLPAFTAGVLQATVQAANGAAVPSGATLAVQAVTPRPDAPASVTVTVDNGRVSQALPTGDYVIAGKVTAGGVPYVVSQPVTIRAGQITQVQLVLGSLPGVAKLVFVTQPVSGLAGIAQPVVLQLRNAQDQLIANGSAPVTLQLLSAGQPLGQGLGLQGNVTVQAQNGVATFSDLRVTLAGSFTLRASAAGLPTADSDAFTLSAGAAAGFALSPNATVVAGVASTVPVTAVDAFGNLAPDYAHLVSATSGPSANAGLQPVAMAGGLGLLSLNFTATGPQAIVLTDGQLTSTVTVNVVAGPVAALAFLTQPADSNVCTPFAQPVQVALRDAYGNLAANATAPVTLTLDANTPGPLRGHTQAAQQNGVATFNDVTLPWEGDFALHASAGALTATSDTVHITMQPPVVRDVTSTGQSGMIQVAYTVSDACSRPVDMLVQWSGGGQPRINTVSPLNSNITGTQGLTQLRTSPAGVAHTFVWESWADVGRNHQEGVSLNLTPTVASLTGDPVTLDNLTVDNVLGPATLESAIVVRSPVPNVAQLAAADLDRNGTQDVVSLASDKLLLGLTSAAGDVITQVGPFSAGTATQAFALGDVNGDGYQDVVVGSPAGAGLLLGTAAAGLGTLSPQGGANGITALALADFDRDGKQDLVATDGTTSVEVRLSNGNGFGIASTLSGIAPTQIVQVLAVDLDLDGAPDILALDVNHALDIEHNAGSGNFEHNSVSLDGNATAMAVADVNGDGLPDILVGSDSGAVYMVRNDGGMSFESPTSLDSPVQSAIAQMVPGDFDRDGLGDVAVRDVTGGLQFINSSSFQQPSFANFTHPVGGLTSLAVGDVNRDGKPDLLVANATQLGLLRNTQAVIPGLPPTTRFAPLTAAPNDDMAVGELDGDGRTDVVVCTQDAVLVMLGDGDGQYAQRQALAISGAYSPALADVDGDGHTDLILGTRSPAQVSLRRGVGDGTFGAAKLLTLSPSTAMVKLLAADLDGDLLADVALVDNANQVEIFHSAAGVLTLQQTVNAGGNVRDIALGDFNNDGRLDVATANAGGSGSDSITVLIASAYGQYAGSTWSAAAGNDQLAVGDVNGDNVPEVVVTNHSTNPDVFTWSDPNLNYDHDLGLDAAADSVQLGTLGFYGEGLDGLFINSTQFEAVNQLSGSSNLLCTNSLPPDTRSVKLANINGDRQLDVVAASNGSQALVTWQASQGGTLYVEADTTPQNDGQPGPVLLADLDRNGALDVVMADAQLGKLWWSFNNGDGFNTPDHLLMDNSAGPVDLALGDLNHDGYIDVVTANAGNGTLGYLTGQGNGFSIQDMPSLSATPVAVAVGDLNHDGWLDIVVVSTSPNVLQVGLSQQGNYTFTRVALSAAPAALALGDLTGDGVLDAVVASADSTLSVLPGLGDGAFGAATLSTATVHVAGHMTLADLNRDGKLDVVLAHPADGLVSWWLRQGAALVGTKVPVGPQPHRVAVGDVNGDGFLDVVTACADGSVPMVLTDGNGVAVAAPRMYLPLGSAYGAAVGELNHDTRADIVVTQPIGPRFDTLLSGYRRGPLL